MGYFTYCRIPKLLHCLLQLHPGGAIRGDLHGQRGYCRLGVLLQNLDPSHFSTEIDGLVPYVCERRGTRWGETEFNTSIN